MRSLKCLNKNAFDNHKEELYELLQLKKYAKTYASELSGGNRRKLSIAMALIGKPSVIYLDEPTNGLDPSSRKNLYKYLKTLANEDGCVILLTTHEIDEADKICD